MIREFLKNKKAVIFDMDGTLVDSMWMWKDIDIEFLGRFGYEPPANIERDIEGMGFTETAVYFKERFHLPLSVDEIRQCWIDMSIDKYTYEVPLKDGVMEFLKFLKKNQIKTGIATSNNISMVKAVLASLKIDGYLDVITTACEVKKGKPSPDIYLEAARRLETDPSQCLVFEDIPAGIKAGKSAGMTVIAVEDDFSMALKEEKKALADGYIRSYLELIDKE